MVNNSCTLCGTVKPNIEDNSPNPKYITYSNNIRYCKNCPTLNDPQYSGQKIIALTSDVDGVDGQCYRQCLPNRTGYKNIIINDDAGKKPYNSNLNKYDKCDIKCPDHYSIDAATNTCVACPTGQEGTIKVIVLIVLMESITMFPVRRVNYARTQTILDTNFPTQSHLLPAAPRSPRVSQRVAHHMLHAMYLL